MKIKRLLKKIYDLRFGRSLSVGTQNEAIRLKWLESTLKEIPDGSRILDAGAGELNQKKCCAHLKYVSQDFAQYDGKGNDAGLQTKKWDNSKIDIVSDITAIPEPDESFDAIMCIEVFEHLPDPIAAIKEFSRLLRKEGILIITAPFCSLTHFAPYHFYSGFNKYFYENNLTDHGFRIEEIAANGNYFEYLAQEVRRIPEVSDRYCEKKLDFWERRKLAGTLKILSKLTAKDTKSDELLCFGYHVKAIKQ